MDPQKWEYLRKVLGQLPADLRRELYGRPGTLLPDLNLLKEGEGPDDTVAALGWALEILLRQQQGGLELLMDQALALPDETAEAPTGMLTLEEIAVIFMSFPPEVSAPLFKELGAQHIQTIVEVIARLPQVPNQRRTEIMTRFGRLLTAVNSSWESKDVVELARSKPSAISKVIRAFMPAPPENDTWLTTYLERREQQHSHSEADKGYPLRDTLYQRSLLGNKLAGYLSRRLSLSDRELLDLYLCSEFPPEDLGEDLGPALESLAFKISIVEMQEDIKMARKAAPKSPQEYLEGLATKKKRWLANQLMTLARQDLGLAEVSYSRILEAWLMVHTLKLPLEIGVSPREVEKEWEDLLEGVDRSKIGQGLARRFLFLSLGRDAWIVVRERKTTPGDYIQGLLTSTPKWFLKKLEEFYIGSDGVG